MRPLPSLPANHAVRRFAAVWWVSAAVKVLALAVLLLIVLKLLGGV